MQILEYSITVFKYGVFCLFQTKPFELHKSFRSSTVDTRAHSVLFCILSPQTVHVSFQNANFSEREKDLLIDVGFNFCL